MGTLSRACARPGSGSKAFTDSYEIEAVLEIADGQSRLSRVGARPDTAAQQTRGGGTPLADKQARRVARTHIIIVIVIVIEW